MKFNSIIICFGAILLLCNACVKDSIKRQFKIKVPVYALKTEVYNNIHSNAAIEIKEAGKMFLVGNSLFVTERNKGIHIIDNSNPLSPKNQAFIPIPLNEDVAVKDNVLYADCGVDMLLIDISNPNNVSLINYIPNAFPSKQYQYGYQVDSTRVIVDWIIKDTIVDENYYGNNIWLEGDYVTLQSSYSGNSGSGTQGISSSMARFTIMNNYLYAVSTSTLYCYDISSAEQPVRKSQNNIGWNVETIYPYAGYLLIGSQTGMYIFSVSNPENPQQLSVYTHVNVCDPVIADNNYAYVTLRSGTSCQGFSNQLEVLNIQNPGSPQLLYTLPLTNPHGLAKDGNCLLICDGSAGLRRLDAANPQTPAVKYTYAMPATYDVIMWNGVAYVSAEDGLYLFDYTTDASSLSLLSKIGYNR